MYLNEAYALYLETCEFIWVVKKNLFLKLEAIGCNYESSWLETVLCDTSPNSPCWNNTCVECEDGKKFIPRNVLNEMTTYKQWNALEVPNQSKSNTNYDKTYKMIAIVVKEVRVGEVLDKLQESFGKVKEHQNVKRIQASEFQKDLLDETVRVLEIDCAMAYQCELQKETMGAL